MTLAPAVDAARGDAVALDTGGPRVDRVCEVAEHVAVALALLRWALPLTHVGGGRDPHALVLASLTLGPALVLTRWWRRSLWVVVPPLLVAVAAELVCVVSPTGWSGQDVAASYVYAALLFLVAAGYIRSTSRRTVVVAAIVFAGLDQFARAFLPWWGSGSSLTPMSGTFYWRNPFAAFMLAPALLSLGLVVRTRSPLRIAAWGAAPLAVAGVFFSTSRATLVVLALAWIGLAVALARGGRAAATRIVGVTAVAVAFLLVLPGPPFFAHRASPVAGAAQRADHGETLESNGAYRIQFWHQAAAVAAHHPVTGGGYHSLPTAARLYTPGGWARSQQAHNGYLQTLTDGGLLLTLPFLACWVLVVAHGIRRTRRSLRRPVDDALTLAIFAALLAQLAHSAVDFDWSRPAVLAQAALLAASLASSTPLRSPAVRVGRRFVTAAAVTTGAAVLCVSIVGTHVWQDTQRSVAGRGHDAIPSSVLLSRATAPFGDYRAAVPVLKRAVDETPRLPMEQVDSALSATSAAASVDAHLALLRLRVQAAYGVDRGAAVKVHRLLRSLRGDPASYADDGALALSAAGEPGQAVDVLARAVAQELAVPGAPAATVWRHLYVWATVAGTGADYGCTLRTVEAALGPSPAPSQPPTPSPVARPCRQASSRA